MKKIIFILILTINSASAETYFVEVKNGKVLRIIVAEQEFINKGYVGNPENWIKFEQSKHKNYPGVDFDYDAVKEYFKAPKPFHSWIEDENSKWKAPKPMPNNPNKYYHWDEQVQDWVEHLPAKGK